MLNTFNYLWFIFFTYYFFTIKSCHFHLRKISRNCPYSFYCKYCPQDWSVSNFLHAWLLQLFFKFQMICTGFWGRNQLKRKSFVTQKKIIVTGQNLNYSDNLLKTYKPARSLRTSNETLLVVPPTKKVKTHKFGERTFSYIAPASTVQLSVSYY